MAKYFGKDKQSHMEAPDSHYLSLSAGVGKDLPSPRPARNLEGSVPVTQVKRGKSLRGRGDMEEDIQLTAPGEQEVFPFG